MKLPSFHVNDLLGLLIVVGVPLLVRLDGLPEVASGTFLAGWMMVVTFFFRKKLDGKEGE